MKPHTTDVFDPTKPKTDTDLLAVYKTEVIANRKEISSLKTEIRLLHRFLTVIERVSERNYDR